MEYGMYHDEEMDNIIADASQREFNEECASVQAEADAEQEWLEQQQIRAAEARFAKQMTQAKVH